MAVSSLSFTMNGLPTGTLAASSQEPQTLMTLKRVGANRSRKWEPVQAPLYLHTLRGKLLCDLGEEPVAKQELDDLRSEAIYRFDKILGSVNSNHTFKFFSKTVSYTAADGSLKTADLLAFREAHPKFDAVMARYERAFSQHHPSITQCRRYMPMAHSNGNRRGARPLANPNPILQSLNGSQGREIADCIPQALQWRAESQTRLGSAPLTDVERVALFQTVVSAGVFETTLEEQLEKKINHTPASDPDLAFWQQILAEMKEARFALMTSAAMMPYERTAEAVDRMAEEQLAMFKGVYEHRDNEERNPGVGEWLSRKWNGVEGVAFDAVYPVDFGATLFSGLPAGRQELLAYYERHGMTMKQESLAGLLLRAVVNAEDQGRGLKTAWVDRLSEATPAQRAELKVMIDESHREASGAQTPEQTQFVADQWDAAQNP